MLLGHWWEKIELRHKLHSKSQLKLGFTLWKRSVWCRSSLPFHGYPSRLIASSPWWHFIYKKRQLFRIRNTRSQFLRTTNLYPLNTYKNRKENLKIVSSDTNKIVISQPKGRTYENYRVPLNGPRFLKKPLKNLQGIMIPKSV